MDYIGVQDQPEAPWCSILTVSVTGFMIVQAGHLGQVFKCVFKEVLLSRERVPKTWALSHGLGFILKEKKGRTEYPCTLILYLMRGGVCRKERGREHLVEAATSLGTHILFYSTQARWLCCVQTQYRILFCAEHQEHGGICLERRLETSRDVYRESLLAGFRG